MNHIKIKLPVNKTIGNDPKPFTGMSEFTLNLEPNKGKVEVYFWRPTVSANGAHFLSLPKADVPRFKKARASTLK